MNTCFVISECYSDFFPPLTHKCSWEDPQSACSLSDRSEDFSETLVLQEAKILAGGVASRRGEHLRLVV